MHVFMESNDFEALKGLDTHSNPVIWSHIIKVMILKIPGAWAYIYIRSSGR